MTTLTRRSLLSSVPAALLAPEIALGQGQTPNSPPAIQRSLVFSNQARKLRPEAAESDIIAIDGASPGPALRVKKGDVLELSLENRLSIPVGFHIHGLRGSNAAEGVIGLGSEPIKPNEIRKIRIETPDAGTFLYMPVFVGKTAELLEKGLGGLFIVEDPAPPPVDREQNLILDDWRLTPEGKLAGDFNTLPDVTRAGRLGNILVVNGAPAPETLKAPPGSRLRIRLANISNARVMPMRFENVKATVVSLDGQACDPFDPLKRTVVLVPGSRYDVILDLPSEAGQESRVVVALGNGIAVLKITTEGQPLPARAPIQPIAMNDLPPAIRLQNAVRVDFSINGGASRAATATPEDLIKEMQRFTDAAKVWQINSGFSQGFAGKPMVSVKRGSPVVIAIRNNTDWAQVITVHGHVFRLLHPLDDGWEPYFLDTLYVPERTTARIAFDAGNPGKWAIRSTIAEHFDGGVYSWFEVL